MKHTVGCGVVRQVTAYPFERWPRLSRVDAELVTRCARRLPGVSAGRFRRTAEELLGAPMEVFAQPLLPCPAGELQASVGDPVVAVILEARETGGRIALELEPRLAACVVDRTLGGEGGDAIPPPVTPLGDAARGVLAYAASRLGEGAGHGFFVRTVVTTPRSLAAALGDEGSVVWPFDVVIGADRGVGRAWIPETVLAARAPHGGSMTLAGVRVELVLDAGRGTLTVEALRALRASDVVVPDEMWARPASSGRGVDGTLVARVLGGRRVHIRCAIGADGIVVTAVERTAEDSEATPARLSSETGGDMSEGETERVVGLAGDAPVEVAVEVARVTLRIEELAALRAGEVLATGRAIGERVTIRAGGRAVATGELVAVDGDVGVRILSIE